MKATEVLRQEHETVREAMKVLDAICTRVENGDSFDPEHLEQLLEFIRVFVDECHHGKEEDLLFPAMEKIGIPREQGPIGVMLNEHETMRTHIRAFAGALDEYRDGEESATGKIVENLRAYMTWLDGHIEKENNILFMMAETRLDDETHAELAGEFEQLEEERIGVERHEEFHKMVDSLKETYLQDNGMGNGAKLVAWKIPPRERHPRIFSTFEQLDPGDSFILENDHNPKPLYYEFQAEREGEFSWEYLQEGPDLWQVRIGRVQ